MERRARSSTSVTRRQVIPSGTEAVYPAALGHVVGERGEQVVGGSDGVGVAGEVDVDLIFGLNQA